MIGTKPGTLYESERGVEKPISPLFLKRVPSHLEQHASSVCTESDMLTPKPFFIDTLFDYL